MLFRRTKTLTPHEAAARLQGGELQLVDVRAGAKAGLDAANVRGGVVAWSHAGLPLSRGSRGAGA